MTTVQHSTRALKARPALADTRTRARTKRSARPFGRIGLYLLVLLWLIATLGPYIVMAVTSLTPESQLVSQGSTLFPSHVTFNAYVELFKSTAFLNYVRNSAAAAIGTVVFSLIVAVCAAISLSRFRFHGRTAMLTALLVAQLFPAVLLVIPLSVELRQANLLNSIWGLILVYTTFASPFATYLLKGFLDGLPAELDEAARIDGCSSLQMIWYVILPLLRPGLTAAGTYIFIFSWNEFLYALTFTSTSASQTIPVGLQLFIGDYEIRWDLLTAGGVIAAIPVLVGFMFVQRQLIGGLAAGAVKG
jgi:multiple sugar transport system permease protein